MHKNKLSQETKESEGKHLVIQEVCHTERDNKMKGKMRPTVRTQAVLELSSYNIKSKQSLITSILTIVYV